MSKSLRVIIYIVLVIFFTLFNFYFRPVKGNKLVKKDGPTYINNLYYSDENCKNTLLDDDSKKVYDKIIKDTLNNKIITDDECEIDDCFSKLHQIDSCIYIDHPELLSFYLMSWKKYPTKTTYSVQTMESFRYNLAKRRIEREIDIVKRETKKMNDREKIIFVYDYVSKHNYDRVFTYAGSNQSIYSFFTGGKSVCAGFAKSSQIIFQNIGIESYLVLGYEHMWNYVKYDGKYYVFDATMGASYRDKTLPNHYDGLGETTVEKTIGENSILYPPIEQEKLKDIILD